MTPEKKNLKKNFNLKGELAQQIGRVAENFCRTTTLRCMTIFGGVPISKQISQLRDGVELLISTPGRLIDLVEHEIIGMENVTFCVLDESDELIKRGYEPQVRAIVSQIRPDKQILMFSASWPDNVREISSDYFDEFTHIQIESTNKNIEQIVEFCRESEKMEKLITFLEAINLNEVNKVIIFVDYVTTCKELLSELGYYGFGNDVQSLNRTKSQRERDQVLKDFNDGICKILVSSNIAARGLDIPGLKYVINYDCPRDIEAYIHRIGRTGRGNNSGIAYTLFTRSDKIISNDLVQILSEANQTIDFEIAEMAREVRQNEIEKRTKFPELNERERDGNYFKKIPINKNTMRYLFQSDRAHYKFSKNSTNYSPPSAKYNRNHRVFHNGRGHSSRD